MKRRQAGPSLSLEGIAASPRVATRRFRSPDRSWRILRPYEVDDEERLAEFFEGLTPATRHRYGVSETGLSVAQEWSGAIAIYDKLRFVIEDASGIGDGSDRGSLRGIVEFSLDLTDEDRERFGGRDIGLDPPSTLRFGICLADESQRRGIATAAMAPILDLAARLGRRRVILWGGVLVENGPAIAFYERVGFRIAGPWVNDKGRDCLDMMLDIATEP